MASNSKRTTVLSVIVDADIAPPSHRFPIDGQFASIDVRTTAITGGFITFRIQALGRDNTYLVNYKDGTGTFTPGNEIKDRLNGKSAIILSNTPGVDGVGSMIIHTNYEVSPFYVGAEWSEDSGASGVVTASVTQPANYGLWGDGVVDTVGVKSIALTNPDPGRLVGQDQSRIVHREFELSTVFGGPTEATYTVELSQILGTDS